MLIFLQGLRYQLQQNSIMMVAMQRMIATIATATVLLMVLGGALGESIICATLPRPHFQEKAKMARVRKKQQQAMQRKDASSWS